jgi:type IV secretory pathway TrbF-like protein
MSDVVVEGYEAHAGANGTLSLLAGRSETDLLRITTLVDQGFIASQQRDGNGHWHARNWMRAFFVVLVLCLVMGAERAWMYAHSRDVEVVVQTVVYDKDGQFATVGVPQKLLDYEPEDGQWKVMLSEWVHKKRWKTDEPEQKLTRRNWRWLYEHTCGLAAEQLSRDEMDEKPFVTTSVVRSIKDLSTTKTATPMSYQVLWEESTVDKQQATKSKTMYTGTFQVGRTSPKDADEAKDNPLGLCVTSYDIRKH